MRTKSWSSRCCVPEDWSAGAELEARRAYAGIDTTGFATDAIFPFHPITLRALRAIAGQDSPTIAAMSRLARETLATASGRQAARTSLVYPADLAMNPVLAKQMEMRLAEAGRAARKIAYEALVRFTGNERELAREVVDTLIIESLCDEVAALKFEELESRLPMLAGGGESSRLPVVREILRQLEIGTGGVIRIDADAVSFDPVAAGAPQLSAFNAAIALANRFDPSLTPMRDAAGLSAQISRLDSAMATEVELASRNRTALRSALEEANLELPAQHSAAVADYIELAEAGALALVEAAADPARRDAAIKVIADYQPIAAAAAAIPRMRLMRTYLAATGLAALSGGNPAQRDSSRDSEIAALETECELLGVELGPRSLTGSLRGLGALEARFQKFKWTYVHRYLGEHERWRDEMEHLDRIAGDARGHWDALKRLNSIVALGPPAGEQLGATVTAVTARIVRCEPGHPPTPETIPRCASCGFQLGVGSPRAELDDVMELLKRALATKLAVLSQSMIARLIRNHDREHRLEGFLRITQASQTDALVRVLDENLARYLAQVLDENLSSREARSSTRIALKSIKKK